MYFKISFKPLPRYIIAGFAFIFWFNIAHTTPIQGIEFKHDNWGLVCDNTGTCRAVGYHDENTESLPIYMMLKRNAGPGEPVFAEIRLGYIDDDIVLQDNLIGYMSINNKSVGRLSFNEGVSLLTQDQIAYFIKSLKHINSIEINTGSYKWFLSNKGSYTVITKMDEYQKRIGTIGALVKLGSKDEGDVLLPLSKPVIELGKVPDQMPEDEMFATNNYADILKALRKTLGEDGEDNRENSEEEQTYSDDSICTEFLHNPKPELSSWRLSKSKMLIESLCWRGPYTFGLAFWVISSSRPFNAKLITPHGSDYENGVISSTIQIEPWCDSLSENEWTWSGEEFIHTSEYVPSMCRDKRSEAYMRGNGYFSFPKLITEVK